MLMEDVDAFVGLDVHKDTISVATAVATRDGEMRSWGSIPNERTAVDRMLKKLVARHKTPSLVYEAGPCGYGLYRHLAAKGLDYRVTVPSKMPVHASHRRQKNDTRDAVALARLHRAGELAYVWTSDEVHEAMQDLVCARRIASYQVRKARQRISCYLLRYGHRHDRKRWGNTHRRWLADLRFDHPAQQFALQSYIIEEEQAVSRRAQIDGQLETLLPDWRLAPIVRDLTALRGVNVVIASAVVA
jgi:transposase